MKIKLGWTLALASIAGFVFAPASALSAGDTKSLVGSYALAKRVAADGKTLTGPEVVGFMTFTRTFRTVIMTWPTPEGPPASIAYIAGYSLTGGKYCESVVYGANGNLGAPGVTYDPPSQAPACTAAISDASGVAFDVPGEKLRLSVSGDRIIATTPRWTDHWERVK